jgi:phenylalanine-4-hydroxylase
MGSEASSSSSGVGEAVGPEDLVRLDPDHPGFRDPVYRSRRNGIAQLALRYREGERVPEVAYTNDEQEVWRTVWRSLGSLHQRYACQEYLQSAQALALDRARVPQLAEVNDRLKAMSGFQMKPVAGLVADRVFLGHMGRGFFLSTQYMRHHSRPLYTPEPDVIHELVGHAASLSHPVFSSVNRAFGLAAENASDEQLRRIARVYWYTLEFGVVRQNGRLKVYGAGLLSSFGELERFETQSALREWDVSAMAALPYDPTGYQAQLFVAPSFESMVEDVRQWLEAISP